MSSLYLKLAVFYVIIAIILLLYAMMQLKKEHELDAFYSRDIPGSGEEPNNNSDSDGVTGS